MKINAPELTLMIILIISLLCLFARPIGIVFRVILRGVGYSILVFIINLITAPAGFYIGINAVTSLAFGILGIYGVGAGYFAGLLYSFIL